MPNSAPNDRFRKTRQDVGRDQNRDNRSSQVDSDGRIAAIQVPRQAITHAKTANDVQWVYGAALNPRNRHVRVASDEAHNQRRESQTRRKSQRLKGVTDNPDLDQYEKKGEQEEEANYVDEQERSENHTADDNTAGRNASSRPEQAVPLAARDAA